MKGNVLPSDVVNSSAIKTSLLKNKNPQENLPYKGVLISWGYF
jgi:hypothetical protein